MTRAQSVQLIRGGPGSGKTTCLAHHVQEAVETDGILPARLLWLALDQPARQRQREYFAAQSADARRTLIPVIDTYEGIAYQILQESSIYWGRGIIQPLSERLLVGEVIREVSSAADYYRAEQVRTSSRFRDDVADFIAELKRCKIDAVTFRKQIIPDLPYSVALGDLADIYKRYQQRLQDSQLYDYRGIIWLALLALEDEPLAARWRSQYDLILADDLQDASLLQVELLAALCGRQTRLVAAYEPGQAIYRFRGAVEDPAAQLSSLLAERELVSTELPASQLGRMAPQVAEVARRFASDWALDSAPVAESNRSGQVAVQVYTTLSEELAGVGDQIIDLLQDEEFAPHEIAVIARKHEHIEAARQHLALRGIPVAGSDAAEGGWAARNVLGDIIAVLNYLRNEQSYPTAVREREVNQANLAVSRLATLTGGNELAIAQIYRQCRSEGHFMLPRQRSCSVAALNRWTEAVTAVGKGTVDNSVTAIRSALDQTDLLRELSSRMPPAVGAIVTLLNCLQEADQASVAMMGKGLSLQQARSVIEMTTLPATASDDEGVSVMVAHDARGRAFEVVYLIGVSEETFPASLRVSRLLPEETIQALRRRVRQHLDMPALKLAFAGFGEVAEEAYREEARLFYTCLSRVRQRLYLSCHRQDEGQVAPSPFLLSALPDDFALGPSQKQRQADFECVFWGLAEQRPDGRTSHEGCPVVPCAGRPRLPEQIAPSEDTNIARPPPSREPILADLAPDWPLSASSINSYLRCPRRFFFEKLVGLPGEERGVFLYGTLIHKIMAALNKLPTPQRTLQQAREILTETFAEYKDEFDSPYSYRLYYDWAWQALQAYAATEFFAEESLAQEQCFLIRLRDEQEQPHLFRGRIDQVAAADQAVSVIDYKTSKVGSANKLRCSFSYRGESERYNQPTEDYQLPLYALAWQETADQPVAAVCLQGIHSDQYCRRSCVRIVSDDAEVGDKSFSNAELTQIARFLGNKAQQIKDRPGFEGHPPVEGCTAYFACPYVLICSEAEPS